MASTQNLPSPQPSPAPVLSKKLIEVSSLLILLAGTSTIVLTMVLVIISYSSAPYLDQWRMLDRFARNGGAISLSLLWAQFNEHRTFIPNLFYLADLYVAGGRNIFLLISIFIVQAFHLYVWGYIFSKFAGLSGAVWRTAFGIAAFCLFSPNQYENFVWGFQIAFVIPGLAATISLTALLQHHKQNQDHAQNLVYSDSLLLALFAAVLGSLSMVNGLLIWPLLLLAGIVLRLSFKTLLLIGASAAATLAFYFRGYTNESQLASFLRSQPLEGVKFLLLYFGASWKRISIGLGMALAAAVILIAVTSCSRMLLKKRTVDGFVLLLLEIIFFCIGTASMTAVGRIRLGMAQAYTSRYQTIAMLFWLCAALLVICWLWKPGTKSSTDHIAIGSFQASLLLIMLLICTEAIPLRRELIERRRTLETATLALVTGVPDVSLAGVIPYNFVSQYFDFRAADLMFLLRLHDWVYNDEFYRAYGTGFLQTYGKVSKNECSGSLEQVKPIADTIQRGARVYGWAWDNSGNRPVSKIVLVTPDGLISGLAEGNGYGLARQTSIPHPSQTIWRGFLRGMPQAVSVHAYAIVENGHIACPLDVGSSVPPEFSGNNGAIVNQGP
jgi:hypothetical protein